MDLDLTKLSEGDLIDLNRRISRRGFGAIIDAPPTMIGLARSKKSSAPPDAESRKTTTSRQDSVRDGTHLLRPNTEGLAVDVW